MARTKTATSHDTKQRIADEAVEQFHRKGYNGTSVQDLMSAVGAPKGTFYNHFDSKESLAVEAVQRYAAGLGIATLDPEGLGSPLERIRRHLADLVASGMAVAAESGCLMANLAGEVPAHSPLVAAAIAERLEVWVSSMSRAIDDAKLAGELTTTLPSRDLAEFIVSAWEGGAVRAKASSSLAPVHAFERTVALLLQ